MKRSMKIDRIAGGPKPLVFLCQVLWRSAERGLGRGVDILTIDPY